MAKSAAKSTVKGFEIQLPEVMDFEENYETTASHLSLLRSGSQAGRHLKYLQFDRIQFISPSAALVLASEVDRWQQRIKRKLRADVDRWANDVRVLLAEMGYFELLDITKPPIVGPSEKKNTFLRFKRGDLSDPRAATLAKQLREEIELLVGKRIKRHLLFEGLSEAITNVSQHAYPLELRFSVRQWWLSASWNRVSRVLCVTFYDQGAGIPQTLPKAEMFDYVKDLFDFWRDSQKIKAAMEIGRSKTRMSNRGKGLQNLIFFAKEYSPSQLSIYSQNGLYRMTWNNVGGKVEKTGERRDYETSIGGTLIEWTVRL